MRNKVKSRIYAFAMVFCMICSMLVPPTVSYAAGAPVLTVKADKTSFDKGKGTAKVIYTVSLNPNGNKVGAFSFELHAPAGMTLYSGDYVEEVVSNPEEVALGEEPEYDEVPLFEQGGDGIWVSDDPKVRGKFGTFKYAPTTGYFGASSGTYLSGSTDKVIMTIMATINDVSAVKDYTLDIQKYMCKLPDGVEIPGTAAPTVDTVKVVGAAATTTAIALDQSTLSLGIGDFATLKATVTPADSPEAVTWKSSDTAVATVDAAGKVTGVKSGSATITATSGSKSATCAVTVACTHNNKTDVAAKPATCTEPGTTAGTKCADCGKILSGCESIPATGHKGGTATCTAKAKCTVCGLEYGELATTHNYGTLVTGKAATCTAEGVKDHYKCADCGKLFDTDKKEITTTKIDALGHDLSGWKTDETNHWKECKRCTEIVDKAAHSYTWVIDKPATEGVSGLKHEECVCGLKRNENTIIDHLHKMTHYAAKAATCTAEGNIEYWTCSHEKCAGIYYTDQDGNTTAAEVTLKKLAHTGGTATCANKAVCVNCGQEYGDKDPANHVEGREIKKAVAKTCTENGYTGDIYCTGCGVLIEEGKVIPASHEFEVIVDIAPTVEAEGLGHEVCSVCKTIGATNIEIPKLTHNMVYHPAKGGTCCEDGNIEYWTCTYDDCKGIYYGDANAATVLTSVSTGKAIYNHAGGSHIADAKDANGKAFTNCKICDGCGAILLFGEEVAAAAAPATSDSPKTDDNSMNMIWLFLLAVSGAGLAGACVYNRKRRMF